MSTRSVLPDVKLSSKAQHDVIGTKAQHLCPDHSVCHTAGIPLFTQHIHKHESTHFTLDVRSNTEEQRAIEAQLNHVVPILRWQECLRVGETINKICINGFSYTYQYTVVLY